MPCQHQTSVDVHMPAICQPVLPMHLQIRTVMAREGVAGLYAGYGAFMLRDLPFDAIEFVAYEQVSTSPTSRCSICLPAGICDPVATAAFYAEDVEGDLEGGRAVRSSIMAWWHRHSMLLDLHQNSAVLPLSQTLLLCSRS